MKSAREDAETRGAAKSSMRNPWFLAGIGVPLFVVALTVVNQLRSEGSMADTPQAYSPEKIDGKRAYQYLLQICAIGPRPAGSPANARQRQLVAKHFESQGGVVKEQTFSTRDPLNGNLVEMTNLIGSWFPERKERVLVGAHYDTRPFPDEDPDPAKRRAPFIGANDGASGVALLMEIANHLAKSKTPWGVDLVLFDGEELVYGGGRRQTGEYFLGSKAFAKNYVETRRGRNAPRYSAALVLDMVGDKDLLIEKEQNSIDLASRLVRDVWAAAKGIKSTRFKDRVGPSVLDDHLPLNNAGIPAIDIIDFDYRYWHTAQDVPENCSAESLEEVGRVVTAWLNRPKPRSRQTAPGR